MIEKMKNQIGISKKYRKKINLFFIQDWILLGVAIIVIFYSSTNYVSNNTFVIFGIDRGISLYFGAIWTIIFIIKFFFISVKIKTRLIYEVIDKTDFYSLVIYNKTLVTLDKTLIPLYKDKPDYYLNYLFGVGGTIYLPESKAERFIVEIDNKKYYFLPSLFEDEVLI